jgi:pimeloyl-ACP methyl ester carboxylesterase
VVRWAAGCIAFSGFFLRRDVWSRIAQCFGHFVCVDAMRDDPGLGFTAYLDAAERALRALPPPYLLLGHSFGAVPARLLAARLPAEHVRLALIAGLAVADGLSVAESYQATGQRTMADFCRLNAAAGRIELVDREAFAARLYAPERSPAHPPLAGSEPLALVMESLSLPALTCPCHYVLCRDDQIATAAAQAASADLVQARRLEHGGGHMGPLRDSAWLEQVCCGWPTQASGNDGRAR